MVGRPQQSAHYSAPQLAPLRSTQRANPLLAWAAGGVLSLVVLALTVSDQSSLDWFASRGPDGPRTDIVVGPIQDVVPATTEANPTEAAAVDAETQPAMRADTLPRVMPISPDGRGTARVRAPAATVTLPDLPPLQPQEPLRDSPRLLPISGSERPQPALPPGLQLVGAQASDFAATLQPIDFGREAAAAALRNPAGIRLFIHYAHAQDAATVTRLADYLRRRGFEVAGIRPVGIQIGAPGVRYFFERDLAESERLLKDLGWFFRSMPDRAPSEATDFTHYMPKPRPGNVEIWLPSASS